jgi:signal transduction histidine kinase
MLYISIVLFIIIIVLTAQISLIYKDLSETSREMDEIEDHPENNRQLKSFSANKRIEELLRRVNRIYQARQRERIVYQRRELQIRREIEDISHDLRTPLTSIMGYVNLIQDKESTEAEKDEYLGIIQKRSRLLQSFIQDFYEISRIEGDDYPFCMDSISIQSVVSEAVVAYYHEFEKKNIDVTVSLSEKQSIIIVDKTQFNRIVNNLIQNALKYTKLQFIIKQFVKDDKCYLQFMNDKGNMSEEELKRIFDRFYTGDQTRGSQSTGLGH